MVKQFIEVSYCELTLVQDTFSELNTLQYQDLPHFSGEGTDIIFQG